MLSLHTIRPAPPRGVQQKGLIGKVSVRKEVGSSNPAVLRPRLRVIETIHNWLAEGRFGAGTLLPTEQELCEQLSVSRGTVRAALKQLEEEGAIIGRQGQGRVRGRVVTPQAGTGSSLMSQALVLITHVSADPKPSQFGGALEITDSGVSDAARQLGMHLFVLHPDALDEAGMARVAAAMPRGIVVGPAIADDPGRREFLLAQSQAVPTVVYSNAPAWEGIDRVISDHEQGAYELTRLLIGRGHKKILRFWGTEEDSYWLQMRNAGYEKAMHEAGLPLIPPVRVLSQRLSTEWPEQQFEVRVRHMAGFLVDHLMGDQKVDAIMATSDADAYPTAAACRLFGLTPGKDIAIVGYDNDQDIARRFPETTPPLATVEKFNHQIGEEMVRLLIDRVEGRLPAEPQLRVIKPQVLLLDSSQSR